SPENDAVYDGISRPGVRLVTFAPILKHRLLPLAEILEHLLRISAEGTSAPVGIEFAATLDRSGRAVHDFGFLQLRPLALSAEPFLGIPVSWDEIAGARAIVEAGFKDFRVTPSQGTHFFQNLTASNVGYFTVNPEVGEGFVDWDWLAEQPAVEETTFVRRLQFALPVVVKMN